ncbi:MAG: phosphomannomutase/phosphoglucomutase, partial [candidate division WOR-3 bacterium]
SLIKEKDKPLSILKKSFNDYIIIKEKMAFDTKNFLKMKEKVKNNFIKLFKKPYFISEEDGFFFFKRNFLFHLRPSNTENLLRIIINADDEKIVKQVYEILK